MKNKSVIIVLGFFLLISLIFNYQYFQRYQEDKRAFEVYSNELVYELYLLIQQTEALIEVDSTGERFAINMMDLTSRFDRMDYLLRRSPIFIKEVNGSVFSYFYVTSSLMKSGYSDPQTPPFYLDLELTTYERQFLIDLVELMKEAYEQLTTPEEPSELNPELSPEDFKNVISEYIDITNTYDNRFNPILEKYVDGFKNS
ncbi:hypothetical protein [Evansella clarkii]|uniref:hypothetical protein n=1 Tax=Evansella clarkii TaxID=79879 RepID=UPI000997518C|nr:hypothetical protein [Evansella clarkii]